MKLDTVVNIERIHLQNANCTVEHTNEGGEVDRPIYSVWSMYDPKTNKYNVSL